MNLILYPAGLGPIVSLGFGPSGGPANLATAPTVTGSQPTDLVLIERAGRLQKVAANSFAPSRGIVGVTLSTDGASFVFTFNDESTATVPVPVLPTPPASALPPTAAQVSAALAALPAEQQIATLQTWAAQLPSETTGIPGQLIAGQDGYLRILPTS